MFYFYIAVKRFTAWYFYVMLASQKHKNCGRSSFSLFKCLNFSFPQISLPKSSSFLCSPSDICLFFTSNPIRLLYCRKASKIEKNSVPKLNIVNGREKKLSATSMQIIGCKILLSIFLLQTSIIMTVVAQREFIL